MKTADKDLQFGTDKCTFMIVSKVKPQTFDNSELFVDSWQLKHQADGSMQEEFVGKVPMKEENSLLYLGKLSTFCG